MKQLEGFIKDRFIGSIEVRKKFLEQDFSVLASAIELIFSALSNGKKVLICGNGGSSADAQHFAAELIVRYKKNRLALPAIALTTDTSVLTACANDFSFEDVFSRQVEAIGQEGDVLIAISTSGQSKNVIKAVNMAREKKMKIITLLGNKDSILEHIGDVCIKVPSDNTAYIQEIHESCLHIIAEAIENSFISGGSR